MASKTTLFELFGDFSALWPVRLVGEDAGLLATLPLPDPAVWLGALNNGVNVSDVRTAAMDGRVSLEAKAMLDNMWTGYPNGFPFVLASMPDVEFRIQSTGTSHQVQLFVTTSDQGTEVVLEAVPVEIRLPVGLIEPHPHPDDHPSGIAEVGVGSFSPGSLDSLRVVYRRGNPTSILVHVRLHATAEGKFTIQPAVPISLGKCVFSGLPCLAVHDLTLIPSPSLVPTTVEWIRHSVEPWLPEMSGPLDGLFAVRSVHLDPSEEPFSGAADWLNRHAEGEEPTAEFVLDDLVVPFYAPYVLPIPRHITIGIRRRVLDPGSIANVYDFDQAPVVAYLSRDPAIALIVESFFYKSLPAEGLSTDLGLTFSAGIVFSDHSGPTEGEPTIDKHAIIFGLGENYTIWAGYRRGFSSSTGLPDPGSGAAKVINTILHWEIATIVVDIMAFRLGYSLGRAVGDDASFGNSVEATVDLFVSMPPTGGAQSFFKLRALNGEQVAFAIEGLGWRQGSFHVDGVKFPDGVVAMFGPVGLIINEIGLLAEHGASYLSFSGGVLLEIPSGFKGGVTFRRLRFRISGSPDAPPFKLDGFFIYIWTSTVYIEAGGYYTEKTEDATTIREFGLTGTVRFELSAVEYMFGLDLIAGQLSAPGEEFRYFMFQVFFRGSVTIAWFELRGARLLFALNMQPKLAPADRESRDLRYYNWYKATNPVNVPGDRRLAAWQPQNGTWALGLGVGASIAGLGSALELGVFVLVVVGEDENGLLIVGEVLAMQNPKPLGYFALEWDGKNDRFSLVIGVDLKISSFLRNAPAWSDNIAKLTGTLYISNDPGTFAIGRLTDERTWLSLLWDIDLWAFRSFFQIGFCFEYVDGGPQGVGFLLRVEGGINAGIVRITYNAGFGFVIAAFQTGSSDYAVVVWLEAGLRVVLFGFLRFGISARGELRMVGASPSRGDLSLEIRLETPWFLPDITWKFSVTFGELDPAALLTAVSPLRIAAARDDRLEKSLPVHVERFDLDWDGEEIAQTFSIQQLRAAGSTEAERLARFAANADLEPIAIDSTVSIDWSVAVNDQIGLDPNGAPNLGNQESGDLQLRYDLVGLSLRRRPRFGSDRAWKPLEEHRELGADFSDPAGVELSGSFGAHELTKFWDASVRIAGETATKKLLLNASTPFEFQTRNAEVDEELVRNNPDWPCCPRRHEPGSDVAVHEVIYRHDRPGTDVAAPRLFTDSHSRLTMLRPAYVRPHQFGTNIPAGALVACVTSDRAGPLFRCELDEDAAFCFTRLAWRPGMGTLVLLAFDAQGRVVASKQFPLGTSSDFVNVVLPGQGPIRRWEAWAVSIPGYDGKWSDDGKQHRRIAIVEIDRLAYVGLRDYLDAQRRSESCESGRDDFVDAYTGRGKVAFLPNHEYEIALTTRVSVAHPSTSDESAVVQEYIYFATKGLPGLNAVERVGEEIEHYVASTYSGGRGTLYREEPVALAFNENFSVAVPLAVRPPGAAEERHTLLRMQLLAQPDTALTQQMPFTATGQDWIVQHRTFFVLELPTAWQATESASTSMAVAMISADAYLLRLAALTQRSDSSCLLPDPRDVTGTVLIAPPQGTPDPGDPSRELWPAMSRFTAVVRQEGAGFVDRRPFDEADWTALSFALDGSAGDSAAWDVVDGSLRVAAGAARRFAIFGDDTWNHLAVQVSVKVEGEMAGVGVSLPAGGVPERGLFAVVEKQGDGLALAFYQRTSHAQFDKLDDAALGPDVDADALIPLTVTAYDDRLRAAVGETSLEVPRDEFRDGRVCLLAQGAAAFTALQVSGLDMYAFAFSVSRFRSFEDHILSFNGQVDTITPNAMGAGSTTSTVGALWGATSPEIQAAMQPVEDPARRQALFDRWQAALGLPRKDEVTALELGSFFAAGQAQLFLLESPEPLDFTEEITLRLEQRVRRFGGPIAGGGGVAAGRVRRPGSSVVARRARRSLRDALVGRSGAVEPEPETAEAGRVIIEDIVRQGERVTVELDAQALRAAGMAQEQLVFVEVVEEGRFRFYRGRVEGRAGGARATVRASLTDEVTVGPGGASVHVSEEIAGLAPGAVAILTADLEHVLEPFRPWYEYIEVEVSVLQDGSGHRALFIPVAAGSASPLGHGTYRLTFDLDRRRWGTTAAPDALNSYVRSATIRFAV